MSGKATKQVKISQVKTSQAKSDKIQPNLELMTIKSLIQNVQGKIKDKKFDLDPLYQRAVVWDDNMQMNFIDSVIRGYIPSNIIINRDSSGKWICIDGKQRLTSLCAFSENKIPYKTMNIKNDKNNEDLEIYFNKIPRAKNNENAKTLTAIERKELFLERKIPVAFYDNLSYEIQADIFNRIQYSRVATAGEITHSRFSKEVVAKKFKDLCNEKGEKCFKKIHSRENHVTYILNLMYMVHMEEVKLLSNKARETKFIKDIDDEKIMNKLADDTGKILEALYKDKNPILKKKEIIELNINLKKNFIVPMIYLSYHRLIQKDFTEEDTCNIIIDVWNVWNRKDNKYRTSSSDISMKQLKKQFKICKKQYCVETNNKSNDDESDNSDESNNDESNDSNNDESNNDETNSDEGSTSINEDNSYNSDQTDESESEKERIIIKSVKNQKQMQITKDSNIKKAVPNKNTKVIKSVKAVKATKTIKAIKSDRYTGKN